MTPVRSIMIETADAGSSLGLEEPGSRDAIEEEAVMRVLAFLHGTTIMHASGVGRTREDRVRQVIEGTDPTLRDFAAYVAIGDAAARLCGWRDQGAVIEYLSSHRSPADVAADCDVLIAQRFPPGPVHFRWPGETYGAVAERAQPDVLIEDDCESIGGASEMTYPQVSAEVRQQIRAWVTREFGGIDDLPESLSVLAQAAQG